MSVQFLKLGGSLITDKHQPLTARPEVIKRLAAEIAAGLASQPGLQLVLGHGSGSFGHTPAKEHNTRNGVDTPEGWRGFAEVWRQARALNQIVMESLHAAGLPALAFPVSAAVIATDGRIVEWDTRPLEAALQRELLPVVYGDVAFDVQRGGTILSTEDIFDALAPRLNPGRILLAGLDPVWADFPANTRLVETITPANLAEVAAALGGSAATDVTGGMAAKVQQTLRLVTSLPNCEALIFSGQKAGEVQAALQGQSPGTRLAA